MPEDTGRARRSQLPEACFGLPLLEFLKYSLRHTAYHQSLRLSLGPFDTRYNLQCLFSYEICSNQRLSTIPTSIMSSNNNFSTFVLSNDSTLLYNEALQLQPAAQHMVWHRVCTVLGFFVLIQGMKMLYNAHVYPLRSVPGPWISSATSGWIRWQRWHGRLSFEADKLMNKYGPIVRISPNLVILNDNEEVERVFTRKDLYTSPKAIRALRVGGHDWTVTYPQHPVARQRRQYVSLCYDCWQLQED